MYREAAYYCETWVNFYQAVVHHHCPYDRYLHIIKLYALHYYYYYYYYYYYCCWWCCCNTNLHTHTLLVIMNNSVVEASRNVMANAQKPDFVFRRNGRVHLNRRGSQFSLLLAAEVYASAVVMLDAQSSEVVWWVLACLSVVIVVCCQVEVSAMNWSLVQRSPTDCGASLSVI